MLGVNRLSAVKGFLPLLAVATGLIAYPAAYAAFVSADPTEVDDSDDEEGDWDTDVADLEDIEMVEGDEGDDPGDDSEDDADSFADDGSDDAGDGDADDGAEEADDGSEDDASADEDESSEDADRSPGEIHGSGALRADDEFAIGLDEQGEEVIAGEVIGLVSDLRGVEELTERGVAITSVESLPGLGMQLVVIQVSPPTAANPAPAIPGATSKALFARNHLFPAGAMAASPRKVRTAPRKHRSPKGVVGLIDGGVSSSMTKGLATVESRSFGKRPSAARAHGSAVALRLVASGVATVYSANIFSGRRATALSLVRALDWLAQNKVPVINISLAGPPNPVVHQAIRTLSRRGFVIVAAVGNDGPAAPARYPAAYPEVVGVTAVDGRGLVYRRANRGRQVQFSAKGVAVYVTDATGSSRTVSGTSFAAPIVAARLARSVTAPDVEVRRRALISIRENARDLGPKGWDPIYGYGLVSSP